MRKGQKDLPDAFVRQFPRGRFILQKDGYGSIVITRPIDPDHCLVLSTHTEQWLATGIMTPKEIAKLDAGGLVEVWGEEIRAAAFEELWENHRPVEPDRNSNLAAALL